MFVAVGIFDKLHRKPRPGYDAESVDLTVNSFHEGSSAMKGVDTEVCWVSKVTKTLFLNTKVGAKVSNQSRLTAKNFTKTNLRTAEIKVEKTPLRLFFVTHAGENNIQPPVLFVRRAACQETDGRSFSGLFPPRQP